MLTLFNANLLVIQKCKQGFPHWGESHPQAENLLISSPPPGKIRPYQIFLSSSALNNTFQVINQ